MCWYNEDDLGILSDESDWEQVKTKYLMKDADWMVSSKFMIRFVTISENFYDFDMYI